MVLGRCAFAVGLAAAIFSPASLLAEDLPKPRAGLWESRAISGQGAPDAAAGKQCLDGNSDIQPMMGEKCDLKWKRTASDRIETEAHCKLGPLSVEGKGVIIGDFKSKVRIETTSTVSSEGGSTAGVPQLNIPKQTKTTVIEAVWIGPCEPGQQPGDVILPDGKVIHMPLKTK